MWRDRREAYWPDPHDYVDDDWDEGDRAAVVHALRNGRSVRQFRGESTCRFCGALNGARELTDGTYVWPDGLAHYLEQHSVRLPQPVEAHFLTERSAGDVASLDRTVEGETGDARQEDESWWLSLGSPTWE
jgi:hypothetical protein